MGEEELLKKISKYLASDEWWSPIFDFKTTNCVLFKEGENASTQEYMCYKSFLHTITNLVDCQLCNKLDISADEFEELIYNSYKQKNATAKLIVRTLQNILDFTQFREEMIKENEEAEDEMDEMIEELANNSDIDDMNEEELVDSVGSIVEKVQTESVMNKSKQNALEMERNVATEAAKPREPLTLEENYQQYEQQIIKDDPFNKPLLPVPRVSDSRRPPPHTPNQPLPGLGRQFPIPNKRVLSPSPCLIKPQLPKNTGLRMKSAGVALPPLSPLVL